MEKTAGWRRLTQHRPFQPTENPRSRCMRRDRNHVGRRRGLIEAITERPRGLLARFRFVLMTKLYQQALSPRCRHCPQN